MARVRDGRAAVDAPPAARRTLTRKGPVEESMRRPGSPPKVRQRLLECIYDIPFRTVVRDLSLVWVVTKTDQEWSAELEAALTAARREDMEHGTNAAYVNGCVCTHCQEHQQRQMGRNRGS
jgi:hypothetical protein